MACATCQHPYKVRYNVGNKFPQSASFHCIDCGELLLVGYNKNGQYYFKELVKIEPDSAATVKNLHPELVIDSASSSDPLYHPNIDFVKKSIQAGGGIPKGIEKLRSNQKSVEDFTIEWDKIVKDYRYLKEGRWNLLEKKLGNDKNRIRKYILKHVLKTGKHFLVGKWTQQYKQAFSELQKAKKQPGYGNLKDFLATYADDFLLEKMFNVMQDYREVEHFFLPTLLPIKHDIKPSGVLSAVDWNEVEMIYGNFYEILGELMVVPTTINNLLVRNDHSQFNAINFSLNQYMASDKAKRCDNFSANPKFSFFNEFYEANIRNGTHHKTAKINIGDQTITIKIGKGGVNTRTISFV